MVRKLLLVCLFVGSASIFHGCSSQQSFDYRDATEIPEGPGLMSGNDGAIVSVNTESQTTRDGGLGPSTFIEWKKEFEHSDEMRQYEMWLKLKQQR